MARTTNPDLLKAVHRDGEYLEFIKLHEITPELCLAAVRQNGNALRFVPKEYRTGEICEAAVENKPLALGRVPWDMRTPELCANAWKKDPSAVRYIPDDILTDEVAYASVRRNPICITDVPEKRIIRQMCQEVVRKEWWHADSLKVVTNFALNKKDDDLLNETLERHGFALSYLPVSERTAERCALAMKNDDTPLPYVPKEFQTKDMVFQAVCRNGMNLTYVREDLQTAGVIDAAVHQNGSALSCIPEKERTEARCEKALENAPLALRWVPERLKTPELCMKAVEKNGQALAHVPSEMQTHRMVIEAFLHHTPNPERPLLMCVSRDLRDNSEIVHLAVKTDAENFKLVKKDLITEEMSRAAVLKNPENIDLVPDRIKTFDFCYDMYLKTTRKDLIHNDMPMEYEQEFQKRERLRLAKSEEMQKKVASGKMKLKDVSKELLTYDLCFEAVRHDGSQLGDVPKSYRDYPMCLKAMETSSEAVEFVPRIDRSYSFYHTAVELNPRNITIVPDQMRDREMYRNALANGTHETLRDIPKDMLTPEFVAECARDNKDLWRGVAPYFTEREVARPLEKDPSIYRYLPEILKERPKLAQEASRLDPSNFAYVPNTVKDQAFCDAYISAHPDKLDMLPYDFRTEENCAKALAKDGLQISSVPTEVLTRELCHIAVRSKSEAYEFLPKDLKSYELASQAKITSDAEKKTAEIVSNNQEVLHDLACDLTCPDDDPAAIGTHLLCADLEDGRLFVQVHPEVLSKDEYNERFPEMFPDSVTVLNAYWHFDESETEHLGDDVAEQATEDMLKKDIADELKAVVREHLEKEQEGQKKDLEQERTVQKSRGR